MATSLSKKKYTESQKVKNAFDEYNTYKNTQKPADYSFSDSELLKNTQDKYFNAEKFSYDVYSDPLYNQYKQLYVSEGKKAMENAIGNASAITGGYGNSYAQTAGNLAYNEHLDKLTNVIPELYSAAYSRYEDELDRIEKQLGYLADKDDTEYSRYLDQYKIYSDEVDALRNLYLQEYENDMEIQDSEWESAYKIAMAEQEKAIANANLGYKYYAARQDQAQFEAEMEYKQTQAANDDKYREEELRIQREKVENANEQYWNDYDYKTRETLREDEIYTLLKSGNKYDALCAIDHKYEDDEVAKYKAYLMGFDKKYVESYFKAKNKKGG